MAERLEVQPFSSSVEAIDDAFFGRLPTDLRYKKITFQKFYSVSPLANSDTITLNLPAWTSSTLYLLDQAIVKVRLKILMDDGKVPPPNTNVAPINNVIGSLFTYQKIYFNDTLVSSCTQGYHIRNFIQKTFGYAFTSKTSWLEAGGYYHDDLMEDAINEADVSFTSRRNRFCHDVKKKSKDPATAKTIETTQKVFKPGGADFVGYFDSDFANCTTGIISGVNIRIELKLATAKEFLLCKESGKNPTYQIESFELMVPCAELSESLALKLMNRLKKEDALIKFERTQIIPLTIPTGTPLFFAESKQSGIKYVIYLLKTKKTHFIVIYFLFFRLVWPTKSPITVPHLVCERKNIFGCIQQYSATI